jgi:hypothetical protein
MDYGLWIMDYGLWIMGYGLWVMGYGLWVMGYGLWLWTHPQPPTPPFDFWMQIPHFAFPRAAGTSGIFMEQNTYAKHACFPLTFHFDTTGQAWHLRTLDSYYW